MKTQFASLVGCLFVLFIVLFFSQRAMAEQCTNEPPIILCQPECQLVQVGTSNVTFHITAENPRPDVNLELTYQWQKAAGKTNYQNIVGATSESYSLAWAASADDLAFYRVIVTGNTSITSAPTTLQLWETNSPFTLSGPISYTTGSSGSCPGPFSAFVCFGCRCTNSWGFVTNSVSCSAIDNNRSDTKIQFQGNKLHNGCAPHSITFTPVNPYYRFTVYFPLTAPPTGNSYSIVLDGFFIPPGCPTQ